MRLSEQGGHQQKRAIGIGVVSVDTAFSVQRLCAQSRVYVHLVSVSLHYWISSFFFPSLFAAGEDPRVRCFPSANGGVEAKTPASSEAGMEKRSRSS